MSSPSNIVGNELACDMTGQDSQGTAVSTAVSSGSSQSVKRVSFSESVLVHEFSVESRLKREDTIVRPERDDIIATEPGVSKVLQVYTASILGRRQTLFQPCVFVIEVAGASKNVIVRRYSNFVTLDRQLRHTFSNLPGLPPRSLFRKVVSRHFMDARHAGLAAYISAILSEDPLLSNPSVQQFFGVAPV
eukprot:TRINITY_DN56828_c0_g1_i1.p1 TRINITY_DN56828_c0_g1~~TRINITY_DN56828_c0_g1_i1.p1  ORF type:complete len:190 (+),score=25.89 TRINITY_DN56828_c0_g1_i1:61-630(+)